MFQFLQFKTEKRGYLQPTLPGLALTAAPSSGSGSRSSSAAAWCSPESAAAPPDSGSPSDLTAGITEERKARGRTAEEDWISWKDTHRLFVSEQLLVVLSGTPELLCQLHLTVYGLRQVLGQDVLTSLAGTQQTGDKRWTSSVENSESLQWTPATVSVLTGSSFATLSSWQRRLLTSSSSRVSAAAAAGGGAQRSECCLWNSFWI